MLKLLIATCSYGSSQASKYLKIGTCPGQGSFTAKCTRLIVLFEFNQWENRYLGNTRKF